MSTITLTREFLIEKLLEKKDSAITTATDAKKVLDLVLGTIGSTLSENARTADTRLVLKGIGIIKVSATGERKRLNPKTGETFDQPAGFKFSMKFEKNLREAGK